MKPLFFLLLAANLALAAFVFSDAAPRREVYRAEPLSPEKIRVLSTGSPPPAVSAAPMPAEASAPAAACLEWGPFGASEVAAAEAAIGKLQLGERLQVRQLEVEDNSGYWVYIPPLSSRQEAEQKIAELKNLGINDYFLVQGEGKWKNAISLGIFRTEEAAKVHLTMLMRKGVGSATSGKRERPMKFSVFAVREPDEALAAQLLGLKQSFPGSELKATACAEGG
ncbi:MAG TPA: SPOR domain-containing protein [Burkholderiales bacterium]|nr:SPOR domain-containing protein [Burkholderiales bacterium]